MSGNHGREDLEFNYTEYAKNPGEYSKTHKNRFFLLTHELADSLDLRASESCTHWIDKKNGVLFRGGFFDDPRIPQKFLYKTMMFGMERERERELVSS